MEELKKHIFDERNGLHYTLVDDYYLPDLQLQEEITELKKHGHWYGGNKTTSVCQQGDTVIASKQ